MEKVRSKVRSKTKFWEVKKLCDQILEDTIVAFTLAKPLNKNLYLRVVLFFDLWAMVQLVFHRRSMGVHSIGSNTKKEGKLLHCWGEERTSVK